MRIVYPESSGKNPQSPATAVVSATLIATEVTSAPLTDDLRIQPSPASSISTQTNLAAELAFERIAASVKFNLAQIQHNIEHARSDSLKFFKLTMICVSFGFVLAVVGILISFYSDSKQLGYVTTICSAVPELIAALFFRKDQELRNTIEKYHEELLISQNILTMIDVAETIDNEIERDKIKQQIIVLRLNISASATGAVSGPAVAG